ncbi:uncharacterized protein A1O9_11502 [Exophiala aquamarina CBS 119918]|uniref:Transcription factor domain-containing protein n=1 Tax=Exophiala aquamarina CBS 119918 TaxID=1182545 RepID=A0A072NY01_9EURO|nr:uncharacterized protein A1O9_11502 [Exophiala aquamarina CBS 119918]KEF52262.1 hypothetical protein A1O9_11502 [Exophiala aquamarina CBS 119918]
MTDCPKPPSTLISRIFISLDPPQSNESANSAINLALNSAVYAYSVRWLLVSHTTDANDFEKRDKIISSKKELATNLWRDARQHIYAAMARPTYRSILALYLFGITPSSSNVDLDNIKDPCLETALNHHSLLRSRFLTKTQTADSIVDLLSSGPLLSTEPPSGRDESELKCMTDIAYWFGVISDTTRSLTRCRPSVLLPGQSGEKKVWSAVRQRTDAFEREFQSLIDLRAPLSDSLVTLILQHAFAFKTLVWAAITRVQDAVFHQLSDISLPEAIETVRVESNRFERVFGTLLSYCHRDFMLLNRSTQLSYTLLNIHFQVGSLILADALPSTVTFIDNSSKAYDLRLCACLRIVNAVNVALQTDVAEEDPTSILLLDPYPDQMVNALTRTGSSLFQLNSTDKLNYSNLKRLFTVVITALEILSEISHHAATAVPLLRQKFLEGSTHQTTTSPHDPLHQATLLADGLLDASLVQELEQQAIDPTLVPSTIERNESNIFMSTFLSEEVQFTASDYLSHNWDFDDCFVDF